MACWCKLRHSETLTENMLDNMTYMTNVYNGFTYYTVHIRQQSLKLFHTSHLSPSVSCLCYYCLSFLAKSWCPIKGHGLIVIAQKREGQWGSSHSNTGHVSDWVCVFIGLNTRRINFESSRSTSGPQGRFYMQRQQVTLPTVFMFIYTTVISGALNSQGK